jgi:hypothetical protein
MKGSSVVKRSAAWILLVAGSTVAGEIPPEVMAVIDRAVYLDESDEFVGSYTLTMMQAIQKRSGKGRSQSDLVWQVSRRADGSVEERLTSLKRNGREVSDEKRAEFEKEWLAPDESDSGKTFSIELEIFSSDTLDLYEIGEPLVFGDVVTVTFGPRPAHRKDEGICEGTLAWDRSSLEPLWVDLAVLKPPKPVRELRIRYEYARDGDLVYVGRTETHGWGKLLFFSREFEDVMTFGDVRSGASEPAGD